jgi:hypothetical protein
MIVNKTGKKSWVNRHESFTQDIEDLYDLADLNTGNILNDYNDVTKGVQSLLAEAITKRKRLRALGGEWSWTKIAATKGILLNTKPLNLSFTLSQNNVSNNYAKSPADLYFAQCGLSVKELNDRLRVRSRSLKTSGASNGQTIAGAISTGTHGSAFEIGSIQDSVVGLHLIVNPNRHVWLERASYPVVSSSFVQSLGAELIQDDDLFNAALVSFGSFGFIHGVLIETVPLFLYECHRIRLPIDMTLYRLMETLDFTNSALPYGSQKPYHFQVVINLYDTSGGAYISVMYYRPYHTNYTPPKPDSNPAGDDLPLIVGKITDAVPALVPTVVNKLVRTGYKPYANIWGTHGEIFTNTDTRGQVLSTAMGIPINQVDEMSELVQQVNNIHGPFTGVMAFRYVKKTTAVLGFTRFDPTCIVELDGVDSARTRAFYQAVWNEMERQGIPYTFHWGKVLSLTNSRLRQMYTDASVDAWMDARRTLMNDAPSTGVFTNELMLEWGLQ